MGGSIRMEEDNDILKSYPIKKFFTPYQYENLSEEQRQRYAKLRQEYEVLFELGIPVELPSFMVKKSKYDIEEGSSRVLTRKYARDQQARNYDDSANECLAPETSDNSFSKTTNIDTADNGETDTSKNMGNASHYTEIANHKHIERVAAENINGGVSALKKKDELNAGLDAADAVCDSTYQIVDYIFDINSFTSWGEVAEPGAMTAECEGNEVESGEKAVEPVESMTEPLESIAEPLESITEPFESITEPLESIAEPLERSTEPLESITEPLESIAEPLERSTEPVESITEPLERITTPLESITKPVESIAEPLERSTEPLERIAEPLERSTEPLERSTEPVERRTEPLETSTEPLERIAQPLESITTEPLESITEPLEKIAESLKRITEPLESITPSERIAEPLESITEPIESIKMITKSKGRIKMITKSKGRIKRVKEHEEQQTVRPKRIKRITQQTTEPVTKKAKYVENTDVLDDETEDPVMEDAASQSCPDLLPTSLVKEKTDEGLNKEEEEEDDLEEVNVVIVEEGEDEEEVLGHVTLRQKKERKTGQSILSAAAAERQHKKLMRRLAKARKGYEARLIKNFQEHKPPLPPAPKRKFPCGICRHVFNKSSQLHRHQASFMGDDGLTCNIKRKKITEFKCKHCGKVFNRSFNLDRHIQQKHTSVEENNNLLAMLESKLKASAKSVNEKEFICDICGKVFNRKSNLQRHELTHSDKWPFNCVICGDKFRQSSHLKKHQQYHIDQQMYKCSQCDYQCGKKNCLVMHEATHKKRNVKEYKCNVCGKICNRKDNLRCHQSIHSDGMPFSCEICCDRFKTSRLLKSHQRVHGSNGKNPYKCNQCDKTFATDSSLLMHKLSHSSKQ